MGLFQLNIVLRILVAYFSNYVIGLLNFGLLEWRWKFGIEALPALIFFILLFFIPAAPAGSIKTGRLQEAQEVLALIDNENSEKQFVEISESYKNG
ncbi:MAG: sugar porter family MFS transporter [Bacillus subtilis]|nr:sugar porter family MFS transporter [Bacillus subtilis]